MTALNMQHCSRVCPLRTVARMQAPPPPPRVLRVHTFLFAVFIPQGEDAKYDERVAQTAVDRAEATLSQVKRVGAAAWLT